MMSKLPYVGGGAFDESRAMSGGAFSVDKHPPRRPLAVEGGEGVAGVGQPLVECAADPALHVGLVVVAIQ